MVNENGLPAETRRNVLKYIGAAAGLGVLASQTNIDPFAQRGSALGLGQQTFEQEERRIESFDGTELDTTYYEPASEGPHPAVLMTHGWGGSKADLTTLPEEEQEYSDDVPLAEMYASRGYVVLAYTSRGFGQTENSEGSGGEVNSTSELEQQDASALIDYLAEQDAVMTEGESDPVIGMDGTSYGGGAQLRTAANDDRLNAIIPRATWNDLAQSLAANGVVKQGWFVGLDAGANQLPPTGNLAPEVEETSTGIQERGYMTEEDVEFYQSRSPVSYDEIDTPALFIPEWTDQLFPINQGVANYRKVQESGADTTLLIGQDGTHIFGHPEEFPPGSETSAEFVDQQAVTWMDAYLKGDGEPGLEPYHYYDESADEFTSASEFPPYQEWTVAQSLDETVELTGGDGNIASVDIPITEETEINGIPKVRADVTPTGEGRSHLFVALQRVTDDGAETIKEQVTPFTVEESGTMELELFGVEATLESGESLRLAMSAVGDGLSTTDVRSVLGVTAFVNTPEGSGIELAGDQEVELTMAASTDLNAGMDDTDDSDDSDSDDGTDDSDGDDGMDDSDDGSDDSDNEMESSDGGDEEDSSDDSGPGFGIPAALGGAGGLGYLLRKRLGDDATADPDEFEAEADD